MSMIEPPHRAWDRDKVAGMMRAVRRGETLPPILINGDQAYSGSHRIDARQRLEMDIEFVEIDDDEYTQIMNHLNLDPIYDTVYDFEPFLDAAQELGFAGDAK